MSGIVLADAAPTKGSRYMERMTITNVENTRHEDEKGQYRRADERFLEHERWQPLSEWASTPAQGMAMHGIKTHSAPSERRDGSLEP